MGCKAGFQQERALLLLFIFLYSSAGIDAFVVATFKYHPTHPSKVTFTQHKPICDPIVQRAIASSTMEALEGFWRSSPYTAAGIVCGIKAAAADLIVQKKTKMTDKAKLDIKRNLAFIFYGSMYQGICQEYIYNHLYPLWFGHGTNWQVVLTKVSFDCLIQTTVITLPVAYLVKATIYRYSFRKAMTLYVIDVKKRGLLKKYFSLWAPVNCLTFSVVPEHYRVTWIACVSFFWLMILSSISSPKVKNVDAPKQIISPAVELEEGEGVLLDYTEECSLIDGQTCDLSFAPSTAKEHLPVEECSIIDDQTCDLSFSSNRDNIEKQQQA